MPRPLTLLCLLLLPPVGRSSRQGCLWLRILMRYLWHWAHLLVYCLGLQRMPLLRLHMQLCLLQLWLHLLRRIVLLQLRLLRVAVLGRKTSQVLHLPLPPLHRLLLRCLLLGRQLLRRQLQASRLLGARWPTACLLLCTRRVVRCLWRRGSDSCCCHSGCRCCINRYASWQVIQGCCTMCW